MRPRSAKSGLSNSPSRFDTYSPLNRDMGNSGDWRRQLEVEIANAIDRLTQDVSTRQ